MVDTCMTPSNLLTYITIYINRYKNQYYRKKHVVFNMYLKYQSFTNRWRRKKSPSSAL